MLLPKYVPLVLKQVLRRRTRSLLTVAGVATAMFLYTAVQAMQAGVAATTRATAADTTLVVYRQDRYCPATSALPEDYQRRIATIDGVASVVPMKIVVNNCRTSLDVVTFRGVPKETFLADRRDDIEVVEGSIEDWKRRTDAALLGETLAKRRGLKPGDRFDAAGVTAYVAGVVRSDEPQDANVAYTDLAFIQRASGDGLGVVTQFNVKVTDPALLDRVAEAIDAEFARAQEPTDTYSEKAFIGRVASDLVELVGFARWLGLACLVAVLALVANAIVLSVQDRIAEHAVLQTIGYTGGLIGRLIVTEGVVLALAGGVVGTTAAVGVTRWGRFALSTEGTSIPIEAGPMVIALGLAVCVALGVLAGLVPAWQASRREIAACFRAV